MMLDTDTGPGVSRRTLARGAVWTVPVAMVATAAPASAAVSGQTGCLTALWTEAAYSGAGGRWGFDFGFTNACGTDAKVTSIDVYTTYHAPAGGSTTNPVQSLTPNLSVKGNTAATYVGTGKRVAFDPPPRIGTSSDLPAYYNDFGSAAEDDTGDNGKILCVAKDPTKTAPVYPGDATYPPCAKRLLADSTYAVITYTAGGTTSTIRLDFGPSVGCRVVAGCS